jgi:hypothetical protein
MFSDILELNQGWSSIERAVDVFRAEVGDPQARIISGEDEDDQASATAE